MKTTKELLIDNRELIISGLKRSFKIYKREDIKIKMVGFMGFCEKFPELFEKATDGKRNKTRINQFIANFHFSIMDEIKDNRKWYEIAEDVADQRGLNRDSRTGNMYKIA